VAVAQVTQVRQGLREATQYFHLSLLQAAALVQQQLQSVHCFLAVQVDRQVDRQVGVMLVRLLAQVHHQAVKAITVAELLEQDQAEQAVAAVAQQRQVVREVW
jgi:hypothetical protein